MVLSDRTLSTTGSSERAKPARSFISARPDSSNTTFGRRLTAVELPNTQSQIPTGSKIFVCHVPSCRKRFTTSGNLTRHKRTQHAWLHTAALPCLAVGCKCTFPSETKLERHIAMVHFGASAHACPMKNCGRAFSSTGNLRRHLRRDHEQRNSVFSTTNGQKSRDGEEDDDDPCESLAWVNRLLPSELDEPRSSSSSSSFGQYRPQAVAYTDAELLETLACLFDEE